MSEKAPTTTTPSRGSGGPLRPGGAGNHGHPSVQNSGTAVDNDLAEQLSRLARQMQSQGDSHEVMARIVQTAIALVPGTQEGSISMVHQRRRVTSEAPSGELPRLMDQFQEETGQGPCLDSVYEQETVRVVDLATEPRWPDLAARAGEVGIHGVLCFQLFVHGQDLGALNLLSREVDAFGDESEHVGLLLASHAAIAVADALRIEGVTRALGNRDVIGQAKGILMERFKVTPGRAFELLTQVSQDTNRKLVDVAEELTASGELAPARPR